MSRQNYSLEVISHHESFKNKNLRKYYVEGIETVGAWGDEPFEIKFTNHTSQKVQIKLSVDGTDVLSGEPATTEATPKMWLVNAYGTLALKAWPEDNNGGAQFVFTSANNSVAAHTHGDLSSRGIIAAAVYVESHVDPWWSVSFNNTYSGVLRRRSIADYETKGGTGDRIGGLAHQSICSNDVNNYNNPFYGSHASASFDSMTFNSCTDTNTLGEIGAASANVEKTKESLVSVGAGRHVAQKIAYVEGLKKPTFTETVRVKYMWWDDLVSKLREHNVAAPHPSGFPADKQKNINLGTTPRIGAYTGNAFPREQRVESYPRV